MNTKIISISQGVGNLKGKTIEEIITYVARVSSPKNVVDKFKKPEGLLRYCMKHKHWSIFETGYVTIEIQTSKAIGIQLIRHRSFTFQEFSQRYSEVAGLEPIELRKEHHINRQSSTNILPIRKDVEQHISSSKALYKTLLNDGVARECARMILPMTTSTTIYMTGSIRSWLSFLNVRLDSHAQKEIVLIAKDVALLLKQECPIISKSTNNFNNLKGMFM